MKAPVNKIEDLLTAVLKINSARSRTGSSSQHIKARSTHKSRGQERREAKVKAKQKARIEGMKHRKEINNNQINSIISSNINTDTLEINNTEQ